MSLVITKAWSPSFFPTKKVYKPSWKFWFCNILKLLTLFTDDHNREILKRIGGARDLVTLKAKYHKLLIQKEWKLQYQSIQIKLIKLWKKFTISYNQVMNANLQWSNWRKQSDAILSEPTIKSRLINKFSDQVIFSSRMGGNTYACFSNHLYAIFTDAWYITRSNNIKEEEIKLIDSAAELIRRKIRNSM